MAQDFLGGLLRGDRRRSLWLEVEEKVQVFFEQLERLLNKNWMTKAGA
jgi:hypothetical protein